MEHSSEETFPLRGAMGNEENTDSELNGKKNITCHRTGLHEEVGEANETISNSSERRRVIPSRAC